MPNRVIKDSIHTSEKVNRMSDFQFRLWIGLIVSADDNGCGDARPTIIKGRVFPLRDVVTTKSISKALSSLCEIGAIQIIATDGGSEYKLIGWEELQPDAGRRTPEYRKWRTNVFQRDNYTCQMCGKRGGKLNAHHIKRYRNCISGRTNIENGITLCEECHKAIHHKEGK